MRASLRRSLATLSVLTLGVAACGDDESQTTDSEAEVTDEGAEDDGSFENDGAADDGAAEDPGGEDPAEEPDADAAPDGEAAPAPEQPPEPPMFEDGDLEDGEVVPGVRMDEPEGADIQAGPVPTGSAYVATLPEETGLVFVEVGVGVGVGVDELLGQAEEIEASGQGTIESGPDEIEVTGADEAGRIDLVEVTGGSGTADATLVAAIAGESAVTIAFEMPTDSGDLDVDALIGSIEFDADRLDESGEAPAEAPADDLPTDDPAEDEAAEEPAG